MGKIKEIREKTGLSQVKFSKRYGINPKNVNSWECGITDPPVIVTELLERFVNEDAAENFPKKPQILNVGITRMLEISGLSRKEFAEKYKIPRGTLNRWIYGGKPPRHIFALLERAVREDTYEPWKSYNRSKV